MNGRLLWVLALAILPLAWGCKKPTVAIEPPDPPDLGPDERQPGELTFISFGDWGMNVGGQFETANAMARYVRRHHPVNGALLLGDNFYMKLASTEDPLFQDVFEKAYKQRYLNFPFFPAPGNHDYSTKDLQIELDYSKRHPGSRWRMPANYYRLDWPAEPGSPTPLVTILMLDSDKDNLSKKAWQDEQTWIESELRKPRGTWTICCAHHPLFSNGAHGDTGPLKTTWGLLFQKYKVDFFICGHDHDLQHLEIPGWYTSFVVSGGGASHRPMRRNNRGPWSHSDLGFTYLRFSPTQATVRIIGTDLRVFHEFTRQTDGTVLVTKVSPSDLPDKHPLKLIQGLDEKERMADRPPDARPTSAPSTAPTKTREPFDLLPVPIPIPPPPESPGSTPSAPELLQPLSTQPSTQRVPATRPGDD